MSTPTRATVWLAVTWVVLVFLCVAYQLVVPLLLLLGVGMWFGLRTGRRFWLWAGIAFGGLFVVVIAAQLLVVAVRGDL